MSARSTSAGSVAALLPSSGLLLRMALLPAPSEFGVEGVDPLSDGYDILASLAYVVGRLLKLVPGQSLYVALTLRQHREYGIMTIGQPDLTE
jgi:hypothetical protein